MKNIKIAIASNINFYKLTLPIIIPNLIEVGIDPLDIHVFIAGFTSYTHEIIEGINYHYLDHNSYEYSPLIEICDKQLEPQTEYWFMVHDTCKLGPNFKNLLYNIPVDRPEKIALKSLPAMSIGSYRYDYLLSQKDKLFGIINRDYSDHAMNHWKVWGVPNEDYILWQTAPAPVIYNNNDNWNVVAYENWYNTSTIRRTEYYPSLDLYKNKSNWGQSNPMVRTI